MVTKHYLTKIEIELVPTYHASAPHIAYGIDSISDAMTLTQPTVLTFQQELSAGPHELIIDFTNKQDSDCIPELGLDKYISVGAIKFHNIHLPRFNWLATYEPVFPEPWYSEQNPPPNPIQQGETHLGWNGRWRLAFVAPVFSWIHQLENMGWIWAT